MTDKQNEFDFGSQKSGPREPDVAILMFEAPSLEEIAKVIWQRQHNALPSHAIYHNLNWRDPLVPPKFWDEFLLDARAVLSLLYKKDLEYQKARGKRWNVMLKTLRHSTLSRAMKTSQFDPILMGSGTLRDGPILITTALIPIDVAGIALA